MKTAKRKIILTAITVIIVCATYFLLRLWDDTAVRNDLIDYVNNKIPRAHQLERQAMDYSGSLTGGNYIDDETLFNKLKADIIPVYKSFIDELESIKLKTKKVENINRLYIEAASAQYDAFVAMRDALEKKDGEGLKAAKNKLDENRLLFDKMRTKLAKLAKKENVRIKKAETKN
ncbi:MAG TPA: hypothetical protein PK527_05355 [Smithellaceae bacterium]|nr:hypothetical protein [Smithellaceae bacterium]HQB92568.1 hypothetical protein [Smithellaceae bacterium]